MASAVRKAATGVDYTFSRPPNGYGSQSTVVLADGRPPNDVLLQQQQQQQQEQMRLREEEITRRQAEQKLKQAQEGIARRQQEAEAVAHAARQNLLPPPSYAANGTPSSSSSASPMFSSYSTSTAATTPAYQHTPIEYPVVRHPSMIMPLENPTQYEGESTDSESLHSSTSDYRRIHKPEYRTPTRTIRR